MTGHVFVADCIEPQRAYSTREAGVFLGHSPKTIAAMVLTGEFGEGGAWKIKTTGNHVHAYRVAGWAIEAWRKRNAIRAS